MKSRRTRYEVLSRDSCVILQALTLYGDSNAETDHLLMELVREAMAISARSYGVEEVIVRRVVIEL